MFDIIYVFTAQLFSLLPSTRTHWSRNRTDVLLREYGQVLWAEAVPGDAFGGGFVPNRGDAFKISEHNYAEKRYFVPRCSLARCKRCRINNSLVKPEDCQNTIDTVRSASWSGSYSVLRRLGCTWLRSLMSCCKWLNFMKIMDSFQIFWRLV